MSDFFGIGTAMRGMAHTYFITSRRTGRTMAMLDSLKDGDMVIFSNSKERDRIDRECRKRGLDVRCRTCNPLDIYSLQGTPKVSGRMLFDHSWVEDFYMNALEKVDNEISQWQSIYSLNNEERPNTFRYTLNTKWPLF